MKISFFLILFFLIFSCKKTDKEILNKPEFKELVGTWMPIKKEDNAKKIIIGTDGKVDIYNSTGRGDHFKINFININEYDFLIESDTFNQRFLGCERKNKLMSGITIYKKKNKDTSWVSFGYNENNFIKDSTNADFFFKL